MVKAIFFTVDFLPEYDSFFWQSAIFTEEKAIMGVYGMLSLDLQCLFTIMYRCNQFISWQIGKYYK